MRSRRLAIASIVAVAGLGGGHPTFAEEEVVVVTVTAPGGLPIPDAEVVVRKGTEWETAGRTDAAGVRRMKGVLTDGSWSVGARISLSPFNPAVEKVPTIPITTSAVALHLDSALRFSLRLVDGRTGEAVPGLRWRPLGDKAPAAEGPRFVTARPDHRRLYAYEYALPDGWLPSFEIPPDKYDDLTLPSARIVRPRRMVDPEVGQAEFVIAVRRQARVRVTLLDTRGQPAEPTACMWRWPAGEWADAGFLPGAGGRLTMVPWFSGVPAEFRAFDSSDRATAPERADLPADDAHDARVVLRMRTDYDENIGDPPSENSGGGLIGIGGGRIRDPAGGSIAVRALRRDGRPLRGLKIDVHSKARGDHPLPNGKFLPKVLLDEPLDDRGQALVDQLPPGEYGVALPRWGGLPASRSVTVEAGARVEVVLQEPTGGLLDVSAVGPKGDLLPCADVDVTGPDGTAPVDVAAGVQRLDGTVDAQGRRSFHRVLAGETVLRVRYGPYVGEAKVAVKDGGTSTVTVRADLPKAK